MYKLHKMQTFFKDPRIKGSSVDSKLIANKSQLPNIQNTVETDKSTA